MIRSYIDAKELSMEIRKDLMLLFHEMYDTTDQDIVSFGKEYWLVVEQLEKGYIPTKLDFLTDYQDKVLELIHEYDDAPAKAFNYESKDIIEIHREIDGGHFDVEAELTIRVKTDIQDSIYPGHSTLVYMVEQDLSSFDGQVIDISEINIKKRKES